MKLVLKLNLGVPDAKRFGLEPAEATAGATVDVSDEDGNELLKRGWAVHGSDVDAAASKVVTTPAVELKADPAPPHQPAPHQPAPHPAPPQRPGNAK